MKPHRPNIALDALLVNEKPTGVGRSILELTKAMSEKTWGMNFTVLVTCPELFEWLQECPEWSVECCPDARGGTLRKALFTQFKLPLLCRRLQIDLLHSLQFVAPILLPCPSVVTVHDLAWLRYPETIEEPRRTYYRLMVPGTLGRSAAVVTNSQATADDVHHYYPQCTSVTVTPFGTPSWVWDSLPEPDLESSSRPYFLFVGTLEPRKNLERIIAAFNRLLAKPLNDGESNWPALVLVGGRGWKDSNLQRLMEPLIQAGHLKVLDYCDTPKLKQLYLSAQALLFPSLHEGFGFPILEAMALGLPVITSDKGAMAEVAGQDALLVDAENVHELCEVMARIASSSELRSKLAQTGPSRAKNWSWHKTAEGTAAVYRSILGD